MSQAFVKEGDAQWLHDVAPTLNALIAYLTNENNNIKVYDKESYVKEGREIYKMSNGLSYSIGSDGKWFLLD